MVHKRSQEAFVRRLAVANARRDRELSETICLTTTETFHAALKKEYKENIDVSQASAHKRADILTDSRGRGTLQKKLPQKTEFSCRVICTSRGRTIAIPLPGR